MRHLVTVISGPLVPGCHSEGIELLDVVDHVLQRVRDDPGSKGPGRLDARIVVHAPLGVPSDSSARNLH